MHEKKLRFFAFLVIGLSFLSFFLAFAFYFYQDKVVERKEYYAEVEVASFAGFDVNGTAMIFGAIPPGASAKRKLFVNNSNDFSVVVLVIPHGEIRRFVGAQEVLVENQSAEFLEIKASAPEGMPEDVYEGSLEVLMIRKGKS